MGNWKSGRKPSGSKWSSVKDLLPFAQNTLLKFQRQGVNFQELCKLLESEKISAREKKSYVYALANITADQKDEIWEMYVGDYFDETLKNKDYLTV